uniref:Retrotransposon gag domain-containing protein n=1 Tax=Vitis vinifera TaxID=29760 RepID=A5BL25_VITVI|nr:hypothetical protein VITISV_010205 [Vitis vinifera]
MTCSPHLSTLTSSTTSPQEGNDTLLCKENESLREFVKQFGQAVLQVESYSMDVVLQIFKKSIYSESPLLGGKINKSWTSEIVRSLKRKTWESSPESASSVREQVNSIQPGLADGGIRPINGIITFPPVDPNRVLQPHQDAIILTLRISDFDVRQIFVDPSSSIDLLQMSAFKQMEFPPSALENLRRILSGFNGAFTTSLGDIMLPVQAEPVILNIQFLVIEDLSPFNAIMERTWLHGMKSIPSIYHQMVSYLIEDRQINLYGSQLASHQCYQVACESGFASDNEPPTEPTGATKQ